MLAKKRLGKPDTGKPSVRFDEGSESDGHWPMAFQSVGSGLLYLAGFEGRSVGNTHSVRKNM
jgi:hypothetical protein